VPIESTGFSESRWGQLRGVGQAPAEFRTIQTYPKDLLTLPLAGWKMRQTD